MLLTKPIGNQNTHTVRRLGSRPTLISVSLVSKLLLSFLSFLSTSHQQMDAMAYQTFVFFIFNITYKIREDLLRRIGWLNHKLHGRAGTRRAGYWVHSLVVRRIRRSSLTHFFVPDPALRSIWGQKRAT